MNLLAAACIAATIAQINGLLFQRASKVVVESITDTATVDLRITSQLPLGYKCTVSGRAYGVALFMPDFAKVVQNYNATDLINIKGTGCNGVCSTHVSGVGLSVNCSACEIPFNISEAAYRTDSSVLRSMGPMCSRRTLLGLDTQPTASA